MQSLHQAFYDLKQSLATAYDAGEAVAIAHELLEHITGKNKLQRLAEKETLLDVEQQRLFDDAKAQLQQGMPLQYVTGVQWFMGRRYQVNRHVLIPRPETEELVQWILDDYPPSDAVSILDIGTGSGCIPISLQLALPKAKVTTCDISEDALQVARQNATTLGASIDFRKIDFLDNHIWNTLDNYDVIVSNPPYIPLSERDTLHKNVRDFEPEMALFVPNEDALLFYRNIALFGKRHLHPHGSVYCELHQDYAKATEDLFREMEYPDVKLRTDIHGNHRMLRAK